MRFHGGFGVRARARPRVRAHVIAPSVEAESQEERSGNRGSCAATARQPPSKIYSVDNARKFVGFSHRVRE